MTAHYILVPSTGNLPLPMVFLGGDFNTTHVDWESLSVPHSSNKKSIVFVYKKYWAYITDGPI